MSEVEATLARRGGVHGRWESNAIVSCAILDALALGDGWRALDPVSRAALNQIANKMCRIVSGDATFVDHWHDIQGYARLAERRHAAKAA
jgi:hypothetical protein